MPQAIDFLVCVDSASGGPNMARLGYHQRSTAFWAIAFCAGVPRDSVSSDSKPWRWWKDSSLQMRTIARA
jgi:hypothetical protein